MSDSPQPLHFILAVHNLAGQTELSNSLTIQPDAKLPIDMRSLLTSLGADAAGTFSQGSVSVYFEGTIMPLVGQMTIENPARHWVHQAEMVENDPGRSDIPAVLSGEWWGLAGGRDATIMVTNASGGAVTADVFLAFGGGQHKLDPLVFCPNETKLLSVANMLATVNADVSQAPEGRITLIQRGPNPALVAQGRVTDPVTGFSATLEFPDPARQHASALHASGIPIGTPTADSPFAGDGYFTPHVIASNLTDKPQTAIITLEYPRSATWNSTNGPGGPAAPLVRYVGLIKKGEKNPNEALNHPPNPDPSTLTGQFTLAPLSIGPDSTVDFSLAAVMNQLPLPVPYASLRIQYSGAPGSMIAQVASVDERQDLVVDARTMNEGDGWAGSGANPWHLDANTQSILFLTDESDQPARIGFSVTVAAMSPSPAGTAGGVHYYLTSLKLAPHETRAIDIAKLRDAQVADFKKNIIPASAADGAINWVRLDNVPVMGRVAVITKSGGIASSYDCCACPCPDSYTSLGIDPASWTFAVNASWSCWANAEYDDCNGVQSYYDVTTSVPWSSSNTSVATVDSVGDVGAFEPGTGEINAGPYSDCSYDDMCYCTMESGSAGSPGTVADATPVITGIDPSVWPAGQTTQVTITGIYFGTNAPTLGFSPSSGIGYTLSSYNDTQIVAKITVASGTPNEAVGVTVTNHGYGGLAFNGGSVGASPTSSPAYARVNAPAGTPEVTVVAWINGNAPDLNPLPSGADSSLINDLNSNCYTTIFSWLLKDRVDLGTSADVTYANAWLVKQSANSPPPNPIAPYYYEQTLTNFRLFNDFGGAGGGSGSYQIGTTLNPCGGQSTLLNWLGKGESSQYNGKSDTSPSGETYQLVEGRIGFTGQIVSETINNRTVPWVWSVIEFDSNLIPTFSNVAIFPTYYVYENGNLVAIYNQSSVADFVAKDQTYQLTPSQIP